MKSVDVFKNDPSNKITISNGGVPCGEFEIVRSGPKVRPIFSVFCCSFVTKRNTTFLTYATMVLVKRTSQRVCDRRWFACLLCRIAAFCFYNGAEYVCTITCIGIGVLWLKWCWSWCMYVLCVVISWLTSLSAACFLRWFDTVGWVIWPVKIVPKVSHNKPFLTDSRWQQVF